MLKIKLLSIIAFVIVLLFSSCSHNLYVNYQTDSTNTGTIVIKPNKLTVNTYLTFNDSLIVNKKKVNSVTVNNVPNDGEYKVHYLSENRWYKEKMDGEFIVKMEKIKTVTKLVQLPNFSTGYYIYKSIVYVGGISFLIFLVL